MQGSIISDDEQNCGMSFIKVSLYHNSNSNIKVLPNIQNTTWAKCHLVNWIEIANSRGNGGQKGWKCITSVWIPWGKLICTHAGIVHCVCADGNTFQLLLFIGTIIERKCFASFKNKPTVVLFELAISYIRLFLNYCHCSDIAKKTLCAIRFDNKMSMILGFASPLKK